MKGLIYKNHVFLRKKNQFLYILLPIILICATMLSACKKELDYFDSVSELRSNVLLAEIDDFSLRIYAVEKEYPYEIDGIKRDVSKRAEFRLIAPSGDAECNLSFVFNGETREGELSYDNVKAEYYYSCTLDISKATEIACTLTYGTTQFTLCAKSVKTADTITPKEALNLVVDTDKDTFSALTDKYGFAGEICIRLIYEESPYYYVGVIDRNGKVTAYLLNAESGKILAKRQS